MSAQLNSLNLPDPNKVYRVVQWSAGRVGCSSARAVIRHPKMDLVGMWVWSESKGGKDAGELCGLDPIGVKSTRNVDDVIALKPDCVLYMQEGCNLDDVCKILEAGINIVTTRGEFHFPPRMDPEFRKRTEEACKKGGSSIHSTGASPGFITEAVPLVLTSIARRVDCITIDEFADMPASCSTEMLLDVLRYGRPASEGFDPGLLHHTSQNFEQSLSVVADALGMPFDDIQTVGEAAVALNPIKLRTGHVIEKGTVATQRITVSGMYKGKPLIRQRLNWFCSADTDPKWDIRENGWRVVVEGDTPLDIYFAMPDGPEPFPERMAGYTSHRAVNAVPFVCAAAPGVRTAAELPQIISRLA